MADPRHIAGLAGPTLMAVTTSEALNLDIWTGVSPTLVYLNGVLLFRVGAVLTLQAFRGRGSRDPEA